jgi:hypothetical protein
MNSSNFAVESGGKSFGVTRGSSQVVSPTPSWTGSGFDARDGLRGGDRRRQRRAAGLASRLLAGARVSGVPCHPIHVANDVAVWAVTPDDLAA